VKKLLLLLLLPFFAFTHKEEKTTRLSGYFEMLCYASSKKCPCGLSISSTDDITGNVEHANCLCDGCYYKNVSLIRYIRTNDLDPNKMDDVHYQTKIASKEMQMFLSIDKAILQDAWKKDSLLLKDSTLIKQVESNTVTADLFQAQIDQAKVDFVKKKHYKILVKGEVTALRLKNCPDARGLNKEQYLFLNDTANHLEFVKIINW